MPFFKSSAKPEMDVSGVFSSFDTFAENSRRSASRCSRSVVSSAMTTAPVIWVSENTGVAMI